MAKFDTLGEMIVFRDLETETRAGVPHYVPGQHKARIVKELAQLTYVDVSGQALLIIVKKDKDGDWVMAAPTGIRVGQFYVELVQFPRSFRLTDKMVDCLRATEAEARKKKGAAKNKKSKAAPGGKG